MSDLQYHKMYRKKIKHWFSCSLFLAPPQFKIQYRNQTARRGEDAVLECEAGGETPIGILWSKDKHSVDQTSEPR